MCIANLNAARLRWLREDYSATWIGSLDIETTKIVRLQTDLMRRQNYHIGLKCSYSIMKFILTIEFFASKFLI